MMPDPVRVRLAVDLMRRSNMSMLREYIEAVEREVLDLRIRLATEMRRRGVDEEVPTSEEIVALAEQIPEGGSHQRYTAVPPIKKLSRSQRRLVAIRVDPRLWDAIREESFKRRMPIEDLVSLALRAELRR